MRPSEIAHADALRWSPGERLSDLFEQRCDALALRGRAGHLALSAEEGDLSFQQMDLRANRLARALLAQGLKPGDRMGLLLDKSLNAYVGLLATIKLNVAFVPLDASFPADRIAYIAQDARLTAILCADTYASQLSPLTCPRLSLEASAVQAASLADHRLTASECAYEGDPLAYIVYTSGSTGQPKGVAIEHASICNFVRVAGEVYGIKDDDRVYQGMTLAFDFSTEELWVPLIAGATVVPARSDATLVGRQLADFLIERKVTALCCVPTLLATITVELPQLRFLLVSGEACPQDLVARWQRPGRRMLNAYGPTEATVTASWTELLAGKAVTIGRALPTYTMLMLDPDTQAPVPDGAIGEICIAGPGLAIGYVNRPDLTAKSFIADHIGIPNNPSRRIYRTGDLGRLTSDGEIEYHGRIDTQVKIRGYRIELTEIETVLLEFPGIAQAVVRTYASGVAPAELVGYFTRASGAAPIDPRDIARHLRTRLPGYMVPAFLEELERIPMLPSNKADRKQLPDPRHGRLTTGGAAFVAPRTSTETAIAAALAKVLGLEQVSVEDNFFSDLGGHSLLMTEFVFELQTALPHATASIRDIYLQPTVAKLAQVIDSGPHGETIRPVELVKASRLQHIVCGALQYAFYVTISFVYVVLAIEAYAWQLQATGVVDAYVRALASATGGMAFACLLPIAAKWMLVGRWREERIPIWSLRYLRFWVIKQLVQTSPLVLFRGQPIYNSYLRALGANIGRNASINTRFTPVCTDLLTIGAGAVLAKDSLVQNYRAEFGIIRTGQVSVGAGAYVGEGSVLEIGSTIGDHGQLAHASSLQAGQSIPADRRYWGSPAEPAHGIPVAGFIPVRAHQCSSLRRELYSIVVLALLIGGVLPAIELAAVLAARFSSTGVIAGIIGLSVGDVAALPWLWSVVLGVATSLVLFVGGLIGGLLAVALVPRLLAPLVTPGKVYPLFGFHYAVVALHGWFSNSFVYNIIFGDSSFIVHYLRLIGLDLSVVKQTGSNFGSHQKHDLANLCRIESGTMVSDGLTIINLRQSNSSFMIERAVIGEQSFLGNQVVYIAGARIGVGNLLATKVMVPLDGAVLNHVGLLGSPAFQIPRTVVTERAFDPLAPAQRGALRAKNRHNMATILQYLLLMWGSSLLTLATGAAVYALYPAWGTLAVLAGAGLLPGLSAIYFVMMERHGPGQLTLEPRNCTIHDLHFWRVERYWKMGETPLKVGFKGTPFRPWIYRCLGVRMGRMVFDDGCIITEKGLTQIGDYSCLNEASSLQCHSLEDGLFKSDHIHLGAGCTIAVGAFINYGAEMKERAFLQAGAFLMKGSTVGAQQVWGGNPARATRNGEGTDR
jgi:non-ribosomal peptide synthetase-like protein